MKKHSAASFDGVSRKSPAYNLLEGILRLALVVSLIFAGLSIYRRLPDDTGGAGNTDAEGQTALQITLQLAPDDNGLAMNIPVELYPIDLSAVQREFLSEPRPGVNSREFLARRMSGKSIIEAQLDERGQATVMVTPGKWWVHAVLFGAHRVEWRLPVNVAGIKQSIQLTPDNAYARMKSF
ncbi:MAG TPA: hypothetical protein VEQ40_05615 [Pyrinomonadaceae bacterium]|nr:hypothetical protein [Pyrinomonadaceae bacterium]